jgi:cytochrome c-type biogenesis protein CcmH/NrfF
MFPSPIVHDAGHKLEDHVGFAVSRRTRHPANPNRNGLGPMKRFTTLGISLALLFTPGTGIRAQEGALVRPPAEPPEGAWHHIHEGPNADAHLRVEKAIRCNCGCLLDLHLCQTQMQCEVSQGWSQRILRELNRGDPEETVLAGFAAEFGPTVLMSPPRSGLNLLGYFLPWMAILLTAGVLGSLLHKRGRDPSPGLEGESLPPEEMDRVTRELALLEDQERRATQF